MTTEEPMGRVGKATVTVDWPIHGILRDVIGCVVTVHCGGLAGEASLWGIKADSSDGYRTETMRYVRRQAFEDWRRAIDQINSTWCKPQVERALLKREAGTWAE